MNLFVTGGTGFFGKALLRYWNQLPADQRPQQLTLLTRNPEKFRSEYGFLLQSLPVTLHQGDILDPHSLPKANFTHILHAATDSTVGPQLSPLERYDQIVTGTRHLLDYAVKTKSDRFLLVSSGGVYGPQPLEMEKIPEHYCGMPDPLNPQNAYSVGKRAAEHLCALYQNRFGLSTIIARCFAFVGEDLPLDVHFAIGNFIRDIQNQQNLCIKGNGLPIRSYMYQYDLAHWLAILMKEGKPGSAYNVGSDEGISIKELALKIVKLSGASSRVEIMNHEDTNFKNVYIPDIQKPKQELGLTLKYDLNQSIKETLKVLKGKSF